MLVKAVCRTCLGSSELRPLFPPERPYASVKDDLHLCTGLQIEHHDSLPQFICTPCEAALNAAMIFRKQSQATEQKLLEQLKKQIRTKKIRFNDNKHLKILTNVKFEETYEVPVKTEIEEESSLIVHFPNNVYEVRTGSRIDDLLDSLLTALETSKDLCNFSKANYDGNVPSLKTDPALKEDSNCSILQGNLDVTSARNYVHGPILKNDLNIQKHMRVILQNEFEQAPDAFDDSTYFYDEDSVDQIIQPKFDKKMPSPKPRKAKLTRLDLIDGPPNKNGPNKCRLCKKICPNLKAFYKHLNTKHFGNTKTILCEFCAMRFSDSQKLLRHCRARHGLERDDSFPCSYCSYRALDKEQLEVHERRTHTKERPFVCDNCGAGFFSKRVLIQHSRNHTEDKAFQCDKCPSKFKTRQRLCAHNIKIHLRRFTYACPVCDKRLSKSPYIRRHLLREHGIPVDKQGQLLKVYLHQ